MIADPAAQTCPLLGPTALTLPKMSSEMVVIWGISFLLGDSILGFSRPSRGPRK